MPEPLIDPNRVFEILQDSMFPDDEVPENASIDNLPEGTVLVEGILNQFGFKKERLEKHRQEVHDMLFNLPEMFQQDKGGGWSFLNACQDKNDVQWTGLHKMMDALFSLGQGLGYVTCQMPRSLWSILPGGMPYYSIHELKEGPNDTEAPVESV